jgi:hypothetical protein
MRKTVRLLLISSVATLLLDVPFLVWHGLPRNEIVGFACTIAFFGVFSATGYSSRTRLFGGFKEEWLLYFAVFPATFAVILQAIVVASFSYFDSGTIVPSTFKGRIMLLAGSVTLILSLMLPARLVRVTGSDRA